MDAPPRRSSAEEIEAPAGSDAASPPRRRRRRRPAARVLPLLPLRDTVVFPDAMSPLVVHREASMRLLDHAEESDDRVVLVAVRDARVEDLDAVVPNDLYEVGTEVVVHRRIVLPDGSLRALVQGIRRVRVERIDQERPFMIAQVRRLDDTGDEDADEVRALHVQIAGVFGAAVEHAPYLPDELSVVAANLDEPGELCHLVAGTVRLPLAERQEVLETVDVEARQRLVLGLLSRELELLELGAKIQGEVHSEMSRSQREWFLRRQLSKIQEELGDAGGETIDELRRQLVEARLPDIARRQADRELARLQRTPEQSSEHGVIRGYLEWLASLPWQRLSTDHLELARARRILDRDHHGLDDVKERILDHLAVSRLRGGDLAGAILCLVGPPGVGKTSLGRSVAEALGREFARISVGGMRDESEIRGHRRTYVGAMPGAIIRALRDAGTRNPVFMVDEIDKMGSDWRGDPASAMLEVLDPEQNLSFRDHYLDLPFDLSRALFVCTANRLDTIPDALLDRMEVIELEGYADEEKVAIARRHLVPRQLAAHGLRRGQVKIPVAVIRSIISLRTREPGVRELDRQVAALARKAARRIAEAREEGRDMALVQFTPAELPALLGHRTMTREVARRLRHPGISTGLAVTGAGGEILFVEAAATPGDGSLRVTGQVGKVMEESARAALTWLRSFATAREHAIAQGAVEGDFFGSHDLHVHVPAGAIPKDGPSAGIAMATSLASVWLRMSVRGDLAMTGELTINGDVLPIGGVRQKSLAAERAGIREVVLPRRNEGDARDVPERLARDLRFTFVEHARDVLELAFDR